MKTIDFRDFFGPQVSKACVEGSLLIFFVEGEPPLILEMYGQKQWIYKKFKQSYIDNRSGTGESIIP